MPIQIIRLFIVFMFILNIVSCSDSDSSNSASSSSGSLDTSFNGTGYYIYQTLDNGSWGNAIAIDENDNVLVAGMVSYGSGMDYDMALWKLKPDGEPDTSFAGIGLVTDHNASGGNEDDVANSVTISDEGIIYVGGGSDSNVVNADKDMTAWSFTSDGEFNAAFGNNGIVTHASAAGGGTSANYDSAISCTVDGMGRLLLAGDSVKAAGDHDSALWRYKADGSLDTSFYGTGFFTEEYGVADTHDFTKSILTDHDGNIVVAGYTNYTISGTYDRVVFIAKYFSNGNSVSAFGTDGVVFGESQYGSADGYDAVIDNDNSIIVSGGTENASGGFDLAVWKYFEDGTPDTVFGTDGVAYYAIENKMVNGSSVCLDSESRIVVAGFYREGSANELAVWRFKSDGTADISFGTNGMFTLQDGINGGSFERGTDVAIDSTGRIFVTGQAYDANGKSRMLVICLKP